LEILRKYSWPGNVRELRNVIVQSITAAGGPISPSAIPPQVTQQTQQTHSAPDNPKTLREATRLHIERILHATGGNKSAAARRLGIPLSTLVSKMKKLGVSSC
jgi:DNA-binding NtrC family response regulator